MKAIATNILYTLPKKGFHEFIAWIKKHPFKACLFTSIFSQIAAFFGCNEQIPNHYFALVMTTALVPFLAILHKDLKKITITTLLAMTLASQARAQETTEDNELQPAAAKAVGIIVVVGGVYVIFRMIRFCQRHYDPPPPPPAEEEGEEGALSSPSASVTYHDLGSCYEPVSTALQPASAAASNIQYKFEIIGQLVESNKFQITRLSKVEAPAAVNIEQFNEALTAYYGITLDDHYTGQVHFGRNGQVSTAEDSPFSWDWESNTLTYDPVGKGITYHIVVERSIDMLTWEPYLSARLPLEQKIKISDNAGSEQMFYRFTTVATP